MAAVVWVGGTVFLVIVLVPAIHRPQFDGIGARRAVVDNTNKTNIRILSSVR